MPKPKPTTKAGQSKATIAKLISVATKEFSRKGYAGASTERIVERAGVTRGALYHHFSSKSDLFLAVFREAQQEIGRRIERQAEAAPDLWGQLISGCRAFLEACSDPKIQQIVVIDAPAVLEWNTVRQVDAKMPGSGLSLLKECLAQLVQERVIKPLPNDALAHVLSGAMDEASVWIAQTENPSQALKDAIGVIETLLHSLRT